MARILSDISGDVQSRTGPVGLEPRWWQGSFWVLKRKKKIQFPVFSGDYISWPTALPPITPNAACISHHPSLMSPSLVPLSYKEPYIYIRPNRFDIIMAIFCRYIRQPILGLGMGIFEVYSSAYSRELCLSFPLCKVKNDTPTLSFLSINKVLADY